MKKILINTNLVSNIIKFREELVKNLLEQGNTIYICCINDINLENYEYCKKIKFIDVPLSRHGMNPFSELKLLKYYKKIIREIKPDIIINYTIKPNIYASIVAKKYEIPCITNVTGLSDILFQKSVISKIIKNFMCKGLEKSNYIFAQNKDIVKYLINSGIKKEKIILVAGSGVNTEKYCYLDYPNNKKIIFLYIGRICKNKGVEELKTAFLKLRLVNKNVELNILGSYEEGYENYFKGMENYGIYYYGYQDNIISYINKANAVVLPSYHEGISNVLLESASSGRPLITTDVQGCRDVLIENKTGLLVIPKNSKDLYDKMLNFCNLKNEIAKEMGIEGRKYVSKYFNRKDVINRYLEVINKVLNK